MRRRIARTGRPTVAIAVVTLAGDAVLITASVLHRIVTEDGALGFLTLGRWNGNRDGTFAELWGGIQLLLAALILLRVATLLRSEDRSGRGSTVYIAWAAILTTIAADDYLMIHERAGTFLVGALSLTGVLGLRGQDVGELLIWIMLAALLGGLLAVGHVRAPRFARRDSVVLLVLTVFLAAFGVVLDMLNIVLHEVVGIGTLTALTHVETGGELVAMTLLLLWSAHLLSRQRGQWPSRLVHADQPAVGTSVFRAPRPRRRPVRMHSR